MLSDSRHFSVEPVQTRRSPRCTDGRIRTTVRSLHLELRVPLANVVAVFLALLMLTPSEARTISDKTLATADVPALIRILENKPVSA